MDSPGHHKRKWLCNRLPVHDVSQGLKTKWLFHSTVVHISSAIVKHSTIVHISDGFSVIHKSACNALLWVSRNYDVISNTKKKMARRRTMIEIFSESQ